MGKRIVLLLAVAGLIILAAGYYTGMIIPLPHSYRPAYGDVLTRLDDVKLDAVRLLIGWIVEGKPIPGFGDDYPDLRLMERRKRFVVTCAFVANDAVLTRDRRTYRVDVGECGRVFRKYAFHDTSYIDLVLIEDEESFWFLAEDSDPSFVILVSNTFGTLGGHAYAFRFRETDGGLVAEGKLIGIS